MLRSRDFLQGAGARADKENIGPEAEPEPVKMLPAPQHWATLRY